MARHLLTFLGVANYRKAKYGDEDVNYESTYVLEALLNTKCKDWNAANGDKITVFVTKDAKEKNWLDSEITDSETNEKTLKTGLLSVLSQEKYKHITVHAVDIVEGKTQDEIWQLFTQMAAVIEKGDELYIDITNSFRVIPILMTSIGIFARVMKGAFVKAIYYGAFESDKEIKPFLDFSKFVNIIDWSVAAQQFIDNGNVAMIGNLYEEAEDNNNQGSKELKNMMKMLQYMVTGLDNSQGVGVDDNVPEDKKNMSVLDAYNSYSNSKASYDAYCNSEAGKKDYANEPIRQVVEVLDKNISIFEPAAKAASNLLLGVNAIQWYIDKGKIQLGFTALDETMKTYICDKYGLVDTHFVSREFGCQTVCKHLAKLKPEEEKNGKIRKNALSKWKKEIPEPESEEAKAYFEYRKNDPQIKIVYEKLYSNGNPERIIKEMSYEFVHLKMKVTNSRNSMNHFGFTENNISEDSMKTLKECFEEFKAMLREDGYID